ncbi:CAP domain-containing protein [Streptomyces sp. E5N298]|uniref:CAP domain-containing protein n=1 Tax=Streptomyces sp. E5N298 TaxID=1851983 RepID=UPI00187D63BC|nr:CAP domain-containing protein [Streptomyces sp. E5N298]
MTGTRHPASAPRAVLSTLTALMALLALSTTTVPAWAGPPPAPRPPTPYRAPLWPVPEPGRWQPAPGTAAPGARGDSGGGRPRVTRSGSADSRMVAAVNRQRDKTGCRPVRPHKALGRAAREHSAAMARSGRLTHTGPDGSSPADRMREAGYRVGSAGENLTAGSDSAEAAVAVWMRSAPHRRILLTCRYTHAGVGRAQGSGGPWWTLDLASGR